MRGRLYKALAWILHIAVIAAVTGCVDYDVETVVADQMQDRAPLSFAVIADTHLGSTVGEGAMVKVPRALKNISSHGSLDALVVAGDLTNNGERNEYDQLVQVFSDNSNYIYPVDQFMFMMGNHDNRGISAKSLYQKSLSTFNAGERYPLHSYCVIKGCPFITISMFSRDNHDIGDPSAGTEAYPDDTIEWLQQKMAAAQKDCPGKPIFVFTHMPPKSTSLGSWIEQGNGEAWSMGVLNPVLNKYPQSIVFVGHTHYPIGDPRSIHQGADNGSEHQNFYTVINVGSTNYCEIPAGIVDDGVTPEGYENVTEGVIVTELPNGDIEVRRYDTRINEEISPADRWIVKAPFDGSQFVYAGYDGMTAPEFHEGAVLDLDVSADAVTVTFPQAADNDCVFRYGITVTDVLSGSQVDSASVFSLFYLNSEMPRSLSHTVEGLESGKEYRIEVIAYDSYENGSVPLRSLFVAS